jgi:NLR family CARD domain-containing protein 3
MFRRRGSKKTASNSIESGRRYIGNEATLDLRHNNEDLDEQHVKCIAAELVTNVTLKHLDLSEAKTGDGGAVAIARALAVNKSLTHLRLESNGIADAGMKALAQALRRNNSLTELGLVRNKFGTEGLTSLAKALKKNRGLKDLDLRCNTIGDEGTAILADGLKINGTLASLNLSGNWIGCRGAVALSEALNCNTTLKTLNLCQNFIRDVGAAAFADMLRRNTVLTTLVLTLNRGITDEGATLILNALAECNATLTELDLNYNYYISPTTHSAIKEIVDGNWVGMRFRHADAEMDLSSELCYHPGRAKYVAKELADNPTVTTLLLSRNYLGDEASSVVAAAPNHTLTTIGLDCNYISDAGCLTLATVLHENNVLTQLFLNDNFIGPTGATALAEALHVNTSLQVLELGRNIVGDDGAVAIVDALCRKTSLTGLNLDANNISYVGASVMLKKLKNYNCTSTLLSLKDNADISPVLLRAINAVVKSCWVFHSLVKRLHGALEERAIPLVVSTVHRSCIFPVEAGLAPRAKTTGTAGFVFLLVRAAAANDSNVVKVRFPILRD